MEEMTSKERMKAALSNKQPDRIPVAPDITNMVPCRLTGRPFYEIYANQNPPLWRAYLEAVKHFGMDGWFTYGDLGFRLKSAIEVDSRIVRESNERWFIKNTYNTPDGCLSELIACPAGDPPTRVEKLVKDFRTDFKKLRHLFSEVAGYDDELFERQKEELGQMGIMCVGIFPPGMPAFLEYFQGNLEALIYALYDYPDLFEELVELQERQALQMLEIAIEAGAESIITGGSGSITLQSPELWRKYSLPALKKITKMCREANVISGIHSCGKEMYMVKVCAEETDLDYINPLEVPPMGDCDLAHCKEKYGHRLALMGNLHTVETMLLGGTKDVKRESLKAMLAAGDGGGFVLSTGDQCGRDAPDRNIFTMVDTVKEFGRYPLDRERIMDELKSLQI